MPKQTFFNLPEAKRERIIDAALDEFAANDYPNVSISRLVDRAEIAKGSFYQYFDGKEDLLHHLLSLAADEKRKMLDTPPPDPSLGVFGVIRWLAEEGVRFELNFPRLSQVGYRAVTGNNVPQSILADVQQQSRAFFRRLVAQGKAQGDIDPDVDSDLAVFMFSTIFNELGQFMLDRIKRDDTAAIVSDENKAFFERAFVLKLFQQSVRILEHGMAPKKP